MSNSRNSSRKTTSVLTIGINQEDKDALSEIAINLGCTWGEKANISDLIRKIAIGELKVIPADKKNQPDREVFAQVSSSISSLISLVDLLYPGSSREIINSHLGTEELDDHDLFYEEFIEPGIKQETFVALCQSPIPGQRYFEVEGFSGEDAMKKLYELLESSALPEYTLEDIFANAIVCKSDDPKLDGYKMLLTVSS